MMIATLAAALLMTSSGTKPEQYSERWLCDLWAGAQCHASSCAKDAKDRCLAASKQCKDTSRQTAVTKERADKQAACARALLKGACGAPKPAECDGLM
jgi:hypothetical protein